MKLLREFTVLKCLYTIFWAPTLLNIKLALNLDARNINCHCILWSPSNMFAKCIKKIFCVATKYTLCTIIKFAKHLINYQPNTQKCQWWLNAGQLLLVQIFLCIWFRFWCKFPLLSWNIYCVFLHNICCLFNLFRSGRVSPLEDQPEAEQKNEMNGNSCIPLIFM